MSDEPKKRSRGWILWALFALLVLYPLALGPSMWLMYRMDDGDGKGTAYRAIRQAYAPLIWLEKRSETTRRAVVWYVQVGAPSLPPDRGPR
jgi:hypothetical protein